MVLEGEIGLREAICQISPYRRLFRFTLHVVRP